MAPKCPTFLNECCIIVHDVYTRRNPGAVAIHVVRSEGLRGLYRGFVSNASRNTPGEMIFFATYEQARHLVKQSGQVKDDIGLSRIPLSFTQLYKQVCVAKGSS